MSTAWLSPDSWRRASLPRGQADPRGPAHGPLTSVCDISSLPWCRQLKGAAAWSSTDSPLAKRTSEERGERSNWKLAMFSHHRDDCHVPIESDLTTHRLLQLIPIKVRSELAFYILSESGHLSSSGFQKQHAFAYKWKSEISQSKTCWLTGDTCI